MTTTFLAQWWNLMFLVPLGLALLYLGVYSLSGWTFGEGLDHDFDADADADVHLDADVDADADADVHADLDHASADGDHDAEAEGNGGTPVWLAILSLLGVGRIPVSLVLMVLGLTWGLVGFGANRVIGGERPWAVSLPVAAVSAVVVSNVTAKLVRRYLPLNETYAVPRHNLLGRTGQAIYAIDETFGMATVHDATGTLHQVTCRVAKGHGPIAKGAAVQLSGYSPKDQTFYVDVV